MKERIKVKVSSNKTRQHSLSYSNQVFNSKNLINFKNVSLTHSRFTNCCFENINFKRAAVTGSVFNSCSFINCNLDDADFEFCEFRNSNIKIKRISGCSFNNSNFIDTRFESIDFTGCTFTGAYLENCKINQVHIEYSTLEGAQFFECQFLDVDWRNLNLEFVEFNKPYMNNVVLPFAQIPYMFGVLEYLKATTDDIRIAYGSKTISVHEYLEGGLSSLLDEYEKKQLYLPMSNIYIFGPNTDYNKAFDLLSKEVSGLAAVRDFRGIKFCCKLISNSNMFDRNHLNKIYKYITDADISIEPNSAEMKSFTRNIGEIRSILFKRPSFPKITMRFKTNIGIEYSMRFSNLINQFQKISKPDHTNRVNSTIKLAFNSPLLIDVEIEGDIKLFSAIIMGFLLLAGISPNECTTYPMIKSLLSYRDNNFDQNSLISYAKECKQNLMLEGVEVDLIEYYSNDLYEYIKPSDKSFYVDKKLLQIATRGDVIALP